MINNTSWMYVFTIIITSVISIRLTATTQITPAGNEILFKPLGYLIPELSWATLRVNLNITDMLKETNELCRASKMMDKEYKRVQHKYWLPKSRKIAPTQMHKTFPYLVVSLTNDIQKMCQDNTIRVEEIAEVFKMRNIMQLEHIPNMRNHNTTQNSLIRKTRQVIVGTILAAVGIVTSLVSVFSSHELIKMSSSEDTTQELIDENNHIITSLQSHENGIARNSGELKKLKSQLIKLENEISVENDVNNAFITLFTAVHLIFIEFYQSKS